MPPAVHATGALGRGRRAFEAREWAGAHAALTEAEAAAPLGPDDLELLAAAAEYEPFSTGATYINFQTADEGSDQIRATYGANFERVAAVKQQYDPENVFRVNRNISHAAEGGRS